MAKYSLALAATTAVILSLSSSSASEPLRLRTVDNDNNHWRAYGDDPKSSYSIPTAATAAPTASGISIDKGKEYINYTTVAGYFLQDDPATNPSTFSYV